PFGWPPGNACLVLWVGQRQDVTLPGQDPLEQRVERRRCIGLIHLKSRIRRRSRSLPLRARLLPPAFRQVTDQGGVLGPFYPIPSRKPLVGDAKDGNSIETRHQCAVEGTDRGYETGLAAGAQ